MASRTSRFAPGSLWEGLLVSAAGRAVVNVMVLCGSLVPTGGTQITVVTYIRVLTARGHRVLAVSGDPERPAALPPACEWRSLAPLFSASLRPRSLWRNHRALEALRGDWKRFGADIAHLHFEAPVAIRLLERALPTIRFIHTPGNWCPSGTRWLPRSERICEARAGLACALVDRREGCLIDLEGKPLAPKDAIRRIVDMPIQANLCRHATLIAANSDYTAREIQRLMGATSDRVIVLPPPVEPPVVQPRPPIPGRLFVGARLATFKGVRDAIRVAAALPETHLVVAGDGPDRAELERSARELGAATRVAFLGWVPSATMYEEMQKAQVVLFPSLWPEPFGRVGVEAALMGRPVVGYDAGGVSTWLGPEVGILVPTGDPVAFTEAVASLCRNPGRAEALGASARTAAATFRPEAAGDRLEAAIARAVETWRERGRRTPTLR